MGSCWRARSIFQPVLSNHDIQTSPTASPSARSFPPPRTAVQIDPDDPWAIEHWLGERVAVEFPEWATFELSRDEITLVSDGTGDVDLVAHLLVDHVLPRVVSLRGDLMLHAAGAVGPSGGAHLVLGPAGAGKSTIVTSLTTHGWSLLDDDSIRVTRAENDCTTTPGPARRTFVCSRMSPRASCPASSRDARLPSGRRSGASRPTAACCEWPPRRPRSQASIC